MRKLLAFPGFFVAAMIASSPAWSADQHIRLAECSLLQADIRAIALRALQDRRYNLEEDSPTMLVAEQDDLKVEILFEDTSDIVIRWKEGFDHRSDQWLRNLKSDILWALAE
jgi:hypothetical protein